MESLVISDIELLGGSVASTNAMCPGAIFRLLPGYDPGAPQPDTEVVASLLLDGELNTGLRASNRTMKLPIWIIAPDRDTLAGAREHLQQAVDREMWPLTWARERDTTGTLPPLPVIFDCQRAAATQVDANLIREKQFCMRVTVTFPALPYGRSDTQEQLRFAAPVPSGPPAPPSPVVLDTYSSITSPTCFQSSTHVIGPNSCGYDPDGSLVNDPGGQNTLFTYTSVLASQVDLTGLTSAQMYLGFGSRWYHNLRYHGLEVFRVTLTLRDSNQRTISATRNDARLPVSPQTNNPTFSLVSLPIPLDDPSFSYASVAGYTLEVSNHHHGDDHHLRWVAMYVDALTAYPDTQTAAPVVRGNVITMSGLKGTARTPMSSSFTQPPTAGTATTVTATGTGTYTVPGGTSWIKVEVVGGGGPGGGRTTAGMGGGGGGAEYAREDVFPVVPAEVIPYSVGLGGVQGASPTAGQQTSFGPGSQSTMVVLANGGQPAQQNSITGGLGGTGSTNSVHHDGGKGRTASGGFGGGGGGSGGSSLAGNTPLGSANTSYTSSGSFSFVAPTGVTQVYAEAWAGAGSAGTGYGGGNGQGGGGGEYAAGFIPVTPGNSYTVVVGAGGAAVTGTQLNGNAGGNSSFTGDGGAAVVAHGGGRGNAAGTSTSPNNGGTGSTNTVHFNGGSGGAANPYGGGGGSSASPSGPGNNGDGYSNAGAAPTDGGAGGRGSGATSNNGSNGSAPGGGGGGTYFSGTTSGAGAVGKVRLTFPGGSPDQFGAPAVTGGGAGGNGGATANSVGSAGSQPGGGGGGANSTGTAEAGGAGGAGKIIITPYSPGAFKSLLVARPSRGAPKYFQPLIGVGNGADVPNGSTFYTAPQPVSGVNARYDGTYTVYLINSSFNGSSSRTVTVTFRQTEYSGGPTYTTPTVPISFVPASVTNGVLMAGVVTLPVRKITPDNTQAVFAVSVTDTNTSDRWLDCILVDTMGQVVFINEPSTGYPIYYLDAPNPNRRLGDILGSQTDRSAAVSVMDQLVSYAGGPMAIEPADGENLLFVYCPGALAPNVGVTYFKTYYFDRPANQ